MSTELHLTKWMRDYCFSDDGTSHEWGRIQKSSTKPICIWEGGLGDILPFGRNRPRNAIDMNVDDLICDWGFTDKHMLILNHRR